MQWRGRCDTVFLCLAVVPFRLWERSASGKGHVLCRDWGVRG